MSLAIIQLSLTVSVFLAVLIYYLYQIKKHPLEHNNILSFLDKTDYLLIVITIKWRNCCYQNIEDDSRRPQVTSLVI